MNTVLKISTNNIVNEYNSVINEYNYEIKINGYLDSGERMTYAYATIYLDLGEEYDFNHKLIIYSSIKVDEEGVEYDVNNSDLSVDEDIKNNTYRNSYKYEISPLVSEQYEFTVKMEQFINDVREAVDGCLINGLEYEYNCKIEQGLL